MGRQPPVSTCAAKSRPRQRCPPFARPSPSPLLSEAALSSLIRGAEPDWSPSSCCATPVPVAGFLLFKFQASSHRPPRFSRRSASPPAGLATPRLNLSQSREYRHCRREAPARAVVAPPPQQRCAVPPLPIELQCRAEPPPLL
jgi:hypothetical protein